MLEIQMFFTDKEARPLVFPFGDKMSSCVRPNTEIKKLGITSAFSAVTNSWTFI